jgi:hypothetical protein
LKSRTFQLNPQPENYEQGVFEFSYSAKSCSGHLKGGHMQGMNDRTRSLYLISEKATLVQHVRMRQESPIPPARPPESGLEHSPSWCDATDYVDEPREPFDHTSIFAI